MKAAALLLLFGFTFNLCAQDQGLNGAPSPATSNSAPVEISPYSVVDRSAHRRIWQQVTSTTDPLGNAVYHTNSYNELATGLCFWNGSQWVDSSDQIQITANGASATSGQHQVNFAANINTAGAIDLLSPDGEHMKSHIVGLAYFDSSTGNSVMFAELQDATGQLLQNSNQIIYPNAFTDFQADVRYTYRIGGFEQDIILRQQPPPPSAYGLSSQTTRIQIWTEFTAAPAPQVSSLATNAKTGLINQQLDFGAMKMSKGKAFAIGATNVLTPVAKHWSVIDGRSFLVEEVPLNAIATQLQSLPPPPASSNTNSESNGGSSSLQSASPKLAMASLPRRPDGHILLAPKTTKRTIGTIRLASEPQNQKGLVLDYETVNGTITNCTFQGDTTYFVTNTVYLYGKTTIEGGTVVKFDIGSAGPKIILESSNVVCFTGPYRPAIFTAKDNDSVGSQITGSTGNPYNSYAYGDLDGAVEFTYDAWPIATTLRNLRFSNLRMAVGLQCDIGSFYFYDCQFVRCNQGFLAEGLNIWTYFYNVLFQDGIEVYHVPAYTGNGPSISGINVTARNYITLSTPDDGYTFAGDAYNNTASLSLLNSLFTHTGIGDFSSVSGAVITNYTAFLTSDTGIFQAVGAGSNYLATNSPYQGAGTTNIDATLLLDLRQKTTHPPVIYSNLPVITSNTILAPQASREITNHLDFGYHYDPLDYILDSYTVSNAVVSLTNGVAIGILNNSAGFWLQDGSSLVSQGNPTSPNWLVQYQAVQEQPISIGSQTPANASFLSAVHVGGTGPNLTCLFTKFVGESLNMIPDSVSLGSFNSVVIQNCEFWAGGSYFWGDTGSSVVLDNNLFARSVPNVQTYPTVTAALTNNLVWGAAPFNLLRLHGSGTIYAFNNVFDTCSLTTNSSGFSNGYNAYLNTTTIVTPTLGTNVVSSNSFVYETGPLGSFYQPTNSPLLIMGSTNANLLGLYHFTTQTNEVPEGTNIVTIGYHYVAVDGSGNPLDFNQNGIPDYLENPYGPVPPGLVLVSSTNHYLIGAAPTNIDRSAIILDEGCTNYNGGTLAVSFASGWETNDTLGINNQGTGTGQIGVTNSNVTFGGTSIGTFTLGTSNLNVSFNSNATPTSAQALLTNVTFHYYPGATEYASARTIQFVLTNGCGQASTPVTETITMDCPSSLEVVVLIDCSPSMTNTYNGTQRKIDAAKAAAANFVNSLQLTNDKVALVTFAQTATNNAVMTTNLSLIVSNITNLDAGYMGETAMSNGVFAAQTNFPASADSALRIIIMLTDGVPNVPGTTNDAMVAALNAATSVKQAGIRFVTIGVGTVGVDLDPDLLIAMASSSNDYYYASNTDVLQPIYTSIAQSFCRSISPPVVAITSPTNGVHYNYGSPITITGTATVGDTNRTISKLQLWVNSTYLLSSFTAPPYQSSVTNQVIVTNMPPGTNLLTATATDSGGLVAISSVVTNIVNSRPSVTIVSPTNLATFTQGSTETITISATNYSGVPITNVQLFSLTNLWRQGPVVGTNFTISTNLPVGTYPIMAVATDSNGVWSLSQTVVFKVVSSSVSPYVAITFPTNNQDFIVDSDITITAVASNSDNSVTNVQFFSNGNLLGNSTNAPYSITVCCWKSGTYILTAVAQDSHGAIGISSNVVMQVNDAVTSGVTNFWDTSIAVPYSPDDIPPTVTAMTSDGTNLYVGVEYLGYISDGVDILVEDQYGTILKWNGTTWSEIGTPAQLSMTVVRSIAILGTNIYAAGEVTNALTFTNTPTVKKWDGSGWTQAGNTLYADGDYLGAFPRAFVGISSLAVVDSELYVGGSFTAAGGDDTVQYIARLNVGDNVWEPVGDQLNGPVYSITSWNNSLIVGGSFTTNSSGNTNLNGIAQLVGNTWTNLGTGFGNPADDGFAIWTLTACQSNLFAGGFFNSAEGNTNVTSAAVWNGIAWQAIQGKWIRSPDTAEAIDVSYSPIVFSLVARGDTVYAAGRFAGGMGPDGNLITNYNVGKATWDESQHSWFWSDLDVGAYGLPVYSPANGSSILVELTNGLAWASAIVNNPTNDNYSVYFGGVFGLVGAAQMPCESFARWAVGGPIPPTPPKMVITNPTGLTVYTNPASIDFHAYVVPGNTNVATVAFLLNGTNMPATPDAPGSTNYSATFSSPPPGVYSLGGVVTDSNSPPLASSAYPVSFRVRDTNNSVTAVDDAYVVLANSPSVTFNVLTNDLPANTLHISAVQQFRHDLGSVSVSHDRTYLIYTPLPHVVGTEYLNYTVTNNTGGSDGAAVAVNIVSGPSVYITNQMGTFPASSNVSLGGYTTDLSATVTNLALYINGSLFAQTNVTNFAFIWSTPSVGFYAIQPIATDTFGLTNNLPLVILTVTNAATATNVLTASINNLPQVDNGLGGTVYPVVQQGLFDLQGNADDSNLSDPVSYQLLVYSTDGTLLANVTPQPRDATGFHSGRATNELGIVDFSTLPNGIYDLTLVVHGGGGSTNTTSRFSLDTPLKIGPFSFSEQDMVIPVNGIPITITRTYNSLNNYSVDFGYDWSFALNSMDISLDEVREDVQAGGSEAPYADDTAQGGPPRSISVRTGGGRDVTLTLPNGQRTTFVFTPYAPYPTAYPQWTAPANAHATLQMNATYNTIDLTSLTWRDARGNSSFETFDVPGWLLTTQDGTQYYITRGAQKNLTYMPDPDSPPIDVQAYGPPVLSRILQRTGDELDISNAGITHTNIHGGGSKSVFFQRDGSGRITAIFDPTGGTNGLPALQYVYDQNTGNLLQVLKLQDRVAGTYITNKYHYDNPNFPHYLTSMENPLGVPVARNEYDDQGRLTAVTDAYGNRTVFAHSVSNNVEIVSDPLGNTNSFVYDAQGNVIIKTNALHEVTQMTYDSNNNKLTDYNVALNATTSYGYDNNDYLTATTNTLGFTNLMVFDTHGLLWTNIDAREFMSTNNYDGNGNLLATANAYSTNLYTYDGNNRTLLSVDAYGTTTSNAYDTIGNLTNVTAYDSNGVMLSFTGYAYDDSGNRTNQTVKRSYYNFANPNDLETNYDTTTYFYDAQNRLVETIAYDSFFHVNYSNSVIYNAIGKQQATIDRLGRTNLFFYDDKGNLTNTAYPDGSTEVSVYNALNQRIISYNRMGYTNQYFYDGLGRLTNTVAPDGTSALTIYDAAGRVQYTVDVRGTTNAFGYDLLGQQTSVTNGWNSGSSNVMSFTYDQNGNQITVTDGLGHSSTNVYDQLGRVTTNWLQDQTKVVTAYDALGRKIESIDQTNISTWFFYDGLGRLTGVSNALSQVTTYQYDEIGNELLQVDALRRTNCFAYDSLGRKTVHQRPDGNQESFRYDAAGNLISHYDFNAVDYTVGYEYDAMNRLTNRYYHFDTSSPDYYVSNTFTYTTNGQRATMVDTSGTYTYIYDVMERLKTNITPQGTLYYQYDKNGNVTNITSSTTGGTSVTYYYDSLNRLTNVVDARLSGTQNTALGYDGVGNLRWMRYPNTVTNYYQYDGLNRLTTLTWATNGNTIASFAYQLGTTGIRTGLTESLNGTRTYSWGYDSVYKLTSETIVSNITTSSLGYTYDDVGNRLTRTVSGFAGVGFLTNQSPTYDTNDSLTSDVYDSNGNTTASMGTNYLYDPENRLTNVTVTNLSGTMVSSVILIYDGDGQRVCKIVSNAAATTTNLYLVDTKNLTGYAQVLEESQVSGGATNLARAYTYGLSLISQRLPSGVVHFYGRDGHGNIRFLTDTNASITDAYTYDAFGTLINSTGSTTNVYLYCGEQWDRDVGLYFLRARYMNPNSGRFWTLDTYEGRQDDPLTLHKYLYCSGNPCNGIDPLGRDMWVGKGNTVLGLHQTFDVGDPKGAYNSYSFGMPGGIFGFAKALVGRQSIKGMITVEVGTKTQPKILYQYGYIRSTPAQDTEVIQAMQKIVGAESDYNLATYNCHTFAQGLFYGIAHTFPNQYIPPPPPVVTYQDFSVISDVDPF